MEDNLISPITTPGSKFGCSYLLLPQNIKPFHEKPEPWHKRIQVPYFIALISVVQIAVYCLDCIHGNTALATALAFDPVQLAWQPWLGLSYLVAHDGAAHLAMNVAIQAILATWLLHCQGKHEPCRDLKVATVYLFSGIGGALGAACVQRHVIVGASGAVYGLFWSVTSHLILNVHSTKYIFQQFVSCGFILCCDIAYNVYHVYYDCSPKISWSVHIFGSIYGALLGYAVYSTANFKQNQHAKLLNSMSKLFLIIISIVLVTLIVQISRCSNNRYDYAFVC